MDQERKRVRRPILEGIVTMPSHADTLKDNHSITVTAFLKVEMTDDGFAYSATVRGEKRSFKSRMVHAFPESIQEAFSIFDPKECERIIFTWENDGSDKIE